MPAMQTLDKIAIAMPHAVTISISGRNRKISCTKAHTEKTGGGGGTTNCMVNKKYVIQFSSPSPLSVQGSSLFL